MIRFVMGPDEPTRYRIGNGRSAIMIETNYPFNLVRDDNSTAQGSGTNLAQPSNQTVITRVIPKKTVQVPSNQASNRPMHQPDNNIDIDSDSDIEMRDEIETVDLCTQVPTLSVHARNPIRYKATPPVQQVDDSETDSDSEIEEMSEEIETVDLCTQVQSSNTRALRNTFRNNATPTVQADNSDTDSDSDIEEMPEDIDTVDLCTQDPSSNNLGPQNINRENNRHAPYAQPSTKSEKGIRCPICFRSAKNHEPVSTQCGHIYCKDCISTTLRTSVEQKCPMCKMAMPKENPFHRIFI